MTYLENGFSGRNKKYRCENNVATCRKCGGYKVRNEVGMMSRGRIRRLIYVILATIFFITMTYKLQVCINEKYNTRTAVVISGQSYVADKKSKVFHYSREMPIIFIGGVPRSGTTLMRAMLDAHPEIRCGQETRVIPRILQMRQHWMRSEKERTRLQEAGVSPEVLNAAIAAFVLEVIARHGEPASRLCNKDPLTLKSGDYLMELFPNSKFIFMVRDGRATVHSIISRKVSITGFDLDNYEQCMKKWNDAISIMYYKCVKIGVERCMIVYYEQLVLHPKEWMTEILNFLDIPWNDSVLHHDQMINRPGGVILSKVERSSDQVIKPVNLEALSKWVDHFPEDVLKNIDSIAPMLAKLGYDPYANPPKYGSPDAFVYNNTEQIKKQSSLWNERAISLLSGVRKNLFIENLYNDSSSSSNNASNKNRNSTSKISSASDAHSRIDNKTNNDKINDKMIGLGHDDYNNNELNDNHDFSDIKVDSVRKKTVKRKIQHGDI